MCSYRKQIIITSKSIITFVKVKQILLNTRNWILNKSESNYTISYIRTFVRLISHVFHKLTINALQLFPNLFLCNHEFIRCISQEICNQIVNLNFEDKWYKGKSLRAIKYHIL